MSALLPDIDPEGLSEFSVVFTDRSLNHMSKAFQQVMRDISATLKSVYNAESIAVIPGGGTYAMEAVARQIATDKNCLIIRNGWFSFRWSQIFDAGSIPSSSTVLKARRQRDNRQEPFAPPPIEEVISTIASDKPDLVFAAHVETASGIMLPDAYMRQVAKAAHEVGGLFILDCIASGAIWVDMKDIGVDIAISAPQKGWSASPSAGLVMMNENAQNLVKNTSSTSFACDLKKWLEIMEAYEKGAHAYHATMPTDALKIFRDTMQEIETYGFAKARDSQFELGTKVRELLANRGIKSVAAKGFEAPGVVVSYTDDPDIKNGSKFAGEGMQIAAGVPLQCDESDDFQTFRLGLFGLDKLKNVDATVGRLEAVLDRVIGT
ncbi:MAG: aminotransferase class V-fold PLP-dependent enzyme [Rhizobiaceae bacterium]|nr:aminotransferase class V-fold PLP-dependent enzyme [Rhizobiaceae bacterium]